ncbi:MAG: hypothetical protein COW01_11340 [Bdellovibrionales bacterium CG12_big_fil_rev_8_21_14_0_65_38_15]|nr:MAG: hypothetical protein COW79_11370 [Bdellovibrionales bacterium CG22_combo_CG10-13_8_21_14_all_38_13]PIQ54204.1 MAG: hypothetical protein COW01_11340 [Bdellovibrionales bacterium CG12_big_fil_rev_8_21_14_0_65_38_15]PIR29262.1 MAG: hypothetical protein COV38_10985 [Bdellovibrionales bacterium CG11_big_fil_rev_8_21_14_0_20_38_13]
MKLFSIKYFLFLFLSLSFQSVFSKVPLGVNPRVASEAAIQIDLNGILTKAKFENSFINFSFNESNASNLGKIICHNDKVEIQINAKPSEWSSTFYQGLQELGFLFPHPRIQLSPTKENVLALCNSQYEWSPSFIHRGFHLHTLHSNEWVHGFLMEKPKIAFELVRWLARNGQNVMDLNLLRDDLSDISRRLKAPFKLAQDLGINVGVSIGAALQQQNSFKLIPLSSAVTGIRSEKLLKKNLKELMNAVDFDFLTMEAGTSEFTSVNYEAALDWIEAARATLDQKNKKLMIKVHVSTNQNDDFYGNFNFLPQYSHPEVGILPHTVMFYGLWDKEVPMYGNEDFSSMREFTLEQKNIRPTWYYPETSYWILMDMDVPLFLTDYLVARADDMKRLSEQNVEGHFNFTTGHEVGYWLMDWNVALLANKKHRFDPKAGLKLLGEDLSCWKNIIDFQTKHFKKNQLISVLSFPNLQDEFSSTHRIHERNTVKELSKNPELLRQELEKLEFALSEMPDPSCIKTEELKTMITITNDRIKHAWLTRLALRHKKKSYLREQFIMQAASVRESAKLYMLDFKDKFERYPEANLFDRKSPNPTSYSFGYVYNSVSLNYWEREEKMVKKNRYNPFIMNIYNFLDIIF